MCTVKNPCNQLSTFLTQNSNSSKVLLLERIYQKLVNLFDTEKVINGKNIYCQLKKQQALSSKHIAVFQFYDQKKFVRSFKTKNRFQFWFIQICLSFNDLEKKICQQLLTDLYVPTGLESLEYQNTSRVNHKSVLKHFISRII